MSHPAFSFAKQDQNLFFIGEIGSNHNGSFYRLKSLIEGAKSAGCDAVKLQFYDPERLWDDDIKRYSVRQTCTSEAMLACASAYAKQAEIAIGCSVFDIDYVEKAANIMDFLKISSFECLWPDLIKAARRTCKPLFISTGTCSKMEIYSIVRNAWPQYGDALFHCCSMYPASINNVCFNILEIIIQTFNGDQKNGYSHIGYSDHSKLPGVLYAAIALGVDIIECHIDLEDMMGVESKYSHCWNLNELKTTIQHCRDLKAAMPKNQVIMNGFTDRPDRENIKFRVDLKTGMRPSTK
jgi:sialic acid synthase SpsE